MFKSYTPAWSLRQSLSAQRKFSAEAQKGGVPHSGSSRVTNLSTALYDIFAVPNLY